MCYPPARSAWETPPLGTKTKTATAQGLGSWKFSIDAGESATVRMSNALDWGRGGVGWIVVPGSGGNVTVEYSLLPDGDEDWLEDSGSPFSDTDGDSEPGAFERVRFTAGSATAIVTFLSSARTDAEIA